MLILLTNLGGLIHVCTCNPASLEAELWNGVGGENWGLVGGNSPLIGGWIVRPPVIQH